MENIVSFISLIISFVMLIYFVVKQKTLIFKVAYYESKFKNHRSKFTDKEWEQIETVIKTGLGRPSKTHNKSTWKKEQ
jgi:hypothetical protein